MKKLLIALCICLTTLLFGNIDGPMPSPANLEAGQLKMNANELSAALPLLKARIDRGSFLERDGAITQKTLDTLKNDYNIAWKTQATDALASDKTYVKSLPIYRQSEAAIFTLGKERLRELQQELKLKAEKSEQNYRIGIETNSDKLLAEANYMKIKRVCAALNDSNIQLNDTLSTLPFFLQGANSLSKLPKDELEILIKIEQLNLDFHQKTREPNNPFVTESRANLARLEAAKNLK